MNGIGDLLGFAVCDTTQFRSAQNAVNQAHQNALAQNQLLMQQAGMTNLAGLANMPQPKPSNVTPIRPERTPEEIQAQLEARYAELEREAERRTRFCVNCLHCVDLKCTNRLLIGFNSPEFVGDSDRYMDLPSLKLCGPEKALFEPKPPKPTRWQRFTEWLAKVIERMEGSPPLATRHRKG